MFRLLFAYFRRKLVHRSSAFNMKVLIAIFAIVCYSTSGYMYFEIAEKPDLKWSDALWWSFVTMTTVGYGDHFPTSHWGRFAVGLPTMIFGISILGYLLSTVASYLIEAKSKELKGMKQISDTDHILLVHYANLNRLLGLISELRADSKTAEKPIVLIDSELEELPPELDELGIQFVRGNPARKQALEQANIGSASHAIILSKNPQDVRSDDLTLAVNLAIESLHADITTIAECVDPDSIEIIRRTGCDSVVCVSRFSDSLLVQELLDPGVQEVVEELTDVKGEQIFVQHIVSMDKWQIDELKNWLGSKNLLLIGIKQHESGTLLLNPKDSLKIQKGDRAVFIGSERPTELSTN